MEPATADVLDQAWMAHDLPPVSGAGGGCCHLVVVGAVWEGGTWWPVKVHAVQVPCPWAPPSPGKARAECWRPVTRGAGGAPARLPPRQVRPPLRLPRALPWGWELTATLGPWCRVGFGGRG